LTGDGNHHPNHYAKNTDPHSRSLYKGWAYCPLEDEFQKYLSTVPAQSAEKSTCSYLKAVNKQNRKNMDLTGIIAIQCAHVLIRSTIDMQLGERFVLTDKVLEHTFS
jgi:hypothetical protein